LSFHRCVDARKFLGKVLKIGNTGGSESEVEVVEVRYAMSVRVFLDILGYKLVRKSESNIAHAYVRVCTCTMVETISIMAITM